MKDWLVWVAAVSVLIIAFILIAYFTKFGGSFSNEHTDWGEFGSLLAAITGLIAFIGVLFTLRQNKLQSLESEERLIFFEWLKIFIAYRDNLRVKRVVIKQKDDNQNDLERIVYDDLCKPEETFRQIHSELYLSVYWEIRRSLPKYFTKEELIKIIIPEDTRMSTEEIKDYEYAITLIYFEYNSAKDKKTIVSTRPLYLFQYDHIVFSAIKWYIEHDNLEPIVKAYKISADQCFALYRSQLGPYFRHVYYILDMVSNFNTSKDYAKIFRAQLSKYELSALFFNSFSAQSTVKTRELYLSADLFNNLELVDIRLKRPNHLDIEKISWLENIFPSRSEISYEYVSRDFLNKLYDSMPA